MLNEKNDNDWVKRYITWEVEGIRQRGRPLNTRWDFMLPPPLIGGGIKRCFCLTYVCLSVAYIGPNSRTERPRKTKIGTEVAHITCDSDTTFKVKRSKVKVIRPLYSPRR